MYFIITHLSLEALEQRGNLFPQLLKNKNVKNKDQS